jgi:hypothetical protein
MRCDSSSPVRRLRYYTKLAARVLLRTRIFGSGVSDMKTIVANIAERHGFRRIPDTDGAICTYEISARELWRTVQTYIGVRILPDRSIIINVSAGQNTRTQAIAFREIQTALESRFGKQHVRNTSSTVINPI